MPGRLNIVVTKNKSWRFDTVKTAEGLQEAIELAAKENFKEIFIIGGGEIYKQAMPFANTIYLTRVHTSIDGDTFFPAINTAEWDLVQRDDFSKDEKHAFDYSFEKWVKNK